MEFRLSTNRIVSYEIFGFFFLQVVLITTAAPLEETSKGNASYLNVQAVRGCKFGNIDILATTSLFLPFQGARWWSRGRARGPSTRGSQQ